MTAKGDETNMKLFIIFAAAEREAKALYQEFKSQCSIASSRNECMQALDVSWNKPFKAHVTEQYDDWLANGIHQYIPGRNMKPAPTLKVVDPSC